MTDSPHSEPDPLAFTPVPTQRRRHDGWTPECQHRFVHALAQLGTVSRAARAVGKTYQSAYRLRERPAAESFCAAWDTALLMAHDRAYALAMSRGLDGYTVPRFYKGRQIGSIHRYDNRLLVAVLAPPREAPQLRGRGVK